MNKHIIKLGNNHYNSTTGELIPNGIASPDATTSESKPLTPVNTSPSETTRKTQAHTVKPSQTLMRSAVKKPVIVPTNTNNKIRVQTEIKSTTSASKLTQKISVTSVNHGRLERAQSMVRNDKISRFSKSSVPQVPIRFEHIPIRHAPQTKPESFTTPTSHSRPTNDLAGNDIFSKAIISSRHYVDVKTYATKHRKKAKLHFMSMAIGLVAVVIMVAFAAYLSTPGFQVQIAGIRAGLHSTAPKYQKAGFAFVGVAVQDGRRVIYLKDSLGERYQLAEQVTNWSEQSMLQNVASHKANGTPNYTVRRIGQQNVYRFESGAVSWVKNGTWYNLGGTAALSDNQLKILLQNV